MSRMGSACSMQRNRSSRRSSHGQRGRGTRDGSVESPGSRSPGNHSYSRHSVVAAVPDDSISHLYPTSDNYTMEDNGLRSPKSLADLCTDTLCRSLVYVEGELPPGLPQDVVDDVVASLVAHNALNATTLRVLKNCELGSLVLSGCRGVTDDWLEPLSTRSPTASPQLSAYYPADGYIEGMDLDNTESSKPSEVFYNASHESHEDGHSHNAQEESSCSTASFVSASSTPYAAALSCADHSMLDQSKEGCGNDYQSASYEEQIPSFSITANVTLLDLRGSQRLTDKGLIQLSDLSNLEVARLDNCHSIVGRGLLAFSTSHRLRTLSLANCRRLTDEAVINISHLNTLEALSLDGCRCLTDRSLAAVSGLYRLKKLDLSQCDLLTDAGLEDLEGLQEIEELSLGWCRLISDDGIDVLTRQAGRAEALRVLGVARLPLTDSGVAHLGRLHSLEELDLNGCSSVGSTALGNALSQMPKLNRLDASYCPGILRSSWQGKVRSLKSLDLSYSAVRDSHLSKLTDLPTLEELNLDSCPVGDWAVSHLADNNVVPNLSSLDLADTDLTDLGMVHVAKFTKLKRLSLFYCNISNGGLRHLSKLINLEALNLDSREIGDDGLWHLRNLKSLKSLDIFSGRITDSGCSHIAKIKSLESLELCGGGVSDLGCSMLAQLFNLTSLNLSQNERITNRGAGTLAALSKLKSLNLSNTRVNAAALVHFSDLKQLKSLALYGCRGMDNTNCLDRLQDGLPNLKCVRLNNQGSDEDGIIHHHGTDTDESDDEVFDSYSEGLYASQHAHASEADDSDSEMEDLDGRSSDDGSNFSAENYVDMVRNS